MTPSDQTLWQRLDRFGRGVENALLMVLLCALIGLASLQIALRNFGGGGFVWSDELLRVMVLWVGLFGAVAASRDDNHIKIDLLSRILPERVNRWLRLVINAVTAIICGVLTWCGERFVAGERAFGSTALDGLPVWLLQMVIPIAFGLMAWRYAVFFGRDLRSLARSVNR